MANPNASDTNKDKTKNKEKSLKAKKKRKKKEEKRVRHTQEATEARTAAAIVEVNGHPVKAICDTAADISIVHSDFVQTKNIKIKPARVGDGFTWGDTRHETEEIALLTWNTSVGDITFEAFVSSALDADLLIGQNVLRSDDALKRFDIKNSDGTVVHGHSGKVVASLIPVRGEELSPSVHRIQASAPSDPPQASSSTDSPHPSQNDPLPSLSEFHIDEALGPKGIAMAKAILIEFLKVFSEWWLPGTLGQGRKAHIKTKEGMVVNKAQPAAAAPYLEELYRMVLELEAKGIVERIGPNGSQFNTPVFLVDKPHGGKRFVADFRELNAISERLSFPMHDTKTTLTHLSGVQFMSIFDASSAYHQILLDEESRPKTAFTVRERWQYRALPMGYSSSAQILMQLMTEATRDLDFVLVYMDDFCVYTKSPNWEHHLQHVRTFLERMRQHGIKLSAKKTRIGCTSIEFLGHVIDREGVSAAPSKIAAIQNWKEVKSKKELQSFLGMCNWLRHMVPKYEQLSAPLLKFTKKDVRFAKAEVMPAFQVMRDAVAKNATKLAHPDFSRPMHIFVDGSTVGRGAILAQKSNDQDPSFSPICFAAHKNSSTEGRYDAQRLESDALHWAVCKAFRPYLYGNPTPFIVHTDHKPLTYMANAGASNCKMARQYAELLDYEFKVVPIKGVENPADALSRIGFTSEVPAVHMTAGERSKLRELAQGGDLEAKAKLEAQRKMEREAKAKYRAKKRSQEKGTTKPSPPPPPPPPPPPLSKKEQREARIRNRNRIREQLESDQAQAREHQAWQAEVQNEDKVLNSWFEFLGESLPIDQFKLHLRQDRLAAIITAMLNLSELPSGITVTEERLAKKLAPKAEEADGLLYIHPDAEWNTESECIQKRLLWAPETLRKALVEEAHQVLGHASAKSVNHLIKQRFYWPTRGNDIQDWVQQCHQCARFKHDRRAPAGPHGRHPAAFRGEELSVDFLGPMPVTPRNNQYLLMIVDRCTRFPWVIPTVDSGAESLISGLGMWIAMFGAPRKIRSDAARVMKSAMVKNWAKRLGISWELTTPYHQSSNGLAERRNDDVYSIVGAWKDKFQSDWDSFMPELNLGLRLRYCHTVRNTPYYCMFARDPRLPGQPSFCKLAKELDGSEEARRLRFVQIETIRLATEAARKVEAARDEDRRAECRFEVGDFVMYSNVPARRGALAKFNPKFSGPHRILDQEGDRLYVIQDAEGNTVRALSDRIKRYPGPGSSPNMDPLLRTHFLEEKEEGEKEEPPEKAGLFPARHHC